MNKPNTQIMVLEVLIVKRIVALVISLTILFLLVLPAAGEKAAAPAEVWRSAWQLQEVSLLPESFDGFQLAMCVDLLDLDNIEADQISKDGRVCYFDLSEQECEQLLGNAEPVSIGPSGAVLWVTAGDRSLLVQRDHTLVLLMQSSSRGAKDNANVLASTLSKKGTYYTDVVQGNTRWSPDGRYIFLNEREKWFSITMDLDDPYLIDTHTGEIFLLETDGKEKQILMGNSYQFVECGRFSESESAFYYFLRASTPENGTEHILKRYDLNSGEILECYRTSNNVYDFCECQRDEWFILEYADNHIGVVSLAKNGESYISKTDLISYPAGGHVEIYPLSSGGYYSALIHANFLSRLSMFMPLRWGALIEDGQWYVIDDLSEYGMRQISREEIVRRCSAFLDLNDRQSVVPGMSNVSGIIADSSTLLLSIDYARPVPDSWEGMIEEIHGLVSLYPVLMEMWPVCFAETDFGSLVDQKVYGEHVLLELNETTKAYGPTDEGESWMYYEVRQPEETLEKNAVYICESGMYQCVKADEAAEFQAYQVVTESVSVVSKIYASENGYDILIRFYPDPIPETKMYLIPEAISKDRYNLFKQKMSKVNQKKVANCYSLITPEKLMEKGNKEDLIKRYPTIENNELYILKEDLEDKRLRVVEEAFNSAGYTAEDYEIDMELVDGRPRVPKEKHPVSYVFDATCEGLTRTEILEFAGLCDRINSKIYQTRFAEDEETKETTIENQVVLGILQGRTKENQEDDRLALIEDEYHLGDSRFTVVSKSVDDAEDCFYVLLSVTREEIVPFVPEVIFEFNMALKDLEDDPQWRDAVIILEETVLSLRLLDPAGEKYAEVTKAAIAVQDLIGTDVTPEELKSALGKLCSALDRSYPEESQQQIVYNEDAYVKDAVEEGI